MAKIISVSEAVDLIHNGMTVAALARTPPLTVFWKELEKSSGSRTAPGI